jgi:nucleotide-binding universal stress UspA family protein
MLSWWAGATMAAMEHRRSARKADVLVPLDGSALSAAALPYARAYARAGGHRVVLLHAVAVADARALHGPVALRVARARAGREAVDEAAALDAAAADLARAGVDAEVRIVADEPAAAIRDAAGGAVAAIVMATHGRGGLGRWLYGSVADAVLRGVPAPVLLVPPTAPGQWPDDRVRRALVPLDGSAHAAAVLPYARAFARAFGAEVVLLRVVPPGSPEATAARRELGPPARALAAAGVEVHRSVRRGPVAPTIAAAARRLPADAVAMATHGRGGLARLVLGSVATGVLRLTDVPLLLVRPAGLR